MELQLHESGYRPKRFYKTYGAIKHNTARRLLSEAYGTPTYYQFLSEENLSGLEEEDQLAGKFGSWLKKTAGKVGKFAMKAQQALSPIIGVLPGGGLVNAAFDVVSQVKQAGQPATVEPVITQMPTETPALPTAIAPALMPTPVKPSFLPVPQVGPSITNIPQFTPAAYMPDQQQPPQMFGGMDLKTIALLGLGGLLAFKLLSK